MQESQFVAAASSGFQAAGTVTSAQILVAPNYTSDRMGFRTAAALLACTLTNGGTSSTVWLQVIMILDGGAWKFKAFIPVPQDQLQVAAGGPYVVIEGSTVTIAAIPFNPNNETLAYAWDLDNDGSFETTGQQATFSAASINGPAERTVRVRATGGGSSAVGQTIVTINAPPPASVAIAGAPAIGPEGTAISLGVTTSANVPGVAWTAQRDGATVATGSGATFSFTPADNGTYAVTAAATWSGGTVSASATIAVNNVAPTAIAAPATGAVATDFTIALIAPIDPGMADATAGFEYAFDCGSGYGSFGTAASTSCTAAGEEGFILVGAKIHDHDGAETEYIEFIWVGVSGDSTVTASAPPADRNPAIRHAVAFLTRRLPGTSPGITSWVRPRVPVASQARKGSSGQG